MILSKVKLRAALAAQETRLRALLRGGQLARLDIHDRELAAAQLRSAADHLDRLWVLGEAYGERDSIGSVEYRRGSLAPQLRAQADQLDGVAS